MPVRPSLVLLSKYAGQFPRKKRSEESCLDLRRGVRRFEEDGSVIQILFVCHVTTGEAALENRMNWGKEK